MHIYCKLELSHCMWGRKMVGMRTAIYCWEIDFRPSYYMLVTWITSKDASLQGMPGSIKFVYMMLTWQIPGIDCMSLPLHFFCFAASFSRGLQPHVFWCEGNTVGEKGCFYWLCCILLHVNGSKLSPPDRLQCISGQNVECLRICSRIRSYGCNFC